jgi:hypothetical protein
MTAAIRVSVSLVAVEADAVPAHHRFQGVQFKGKDWDLSHLDAFGMRLDPGLGFEVDVIILFSCHCFTHAIDWGRPQSIPADETFHDGREQRILDEERYLRSKQFLPRLVKELVSRTILITTGGTGQNFVTLEVTEADGQSVNYAMFFDAEKDKHRRKRVLLRIQSAYLLDSLSHRLASAAKVRFPRLIKAAYLGRKI